MRDWCGRPLQDYLLSALTGSAAAESAEIGAVLWGLASASAMDGVLSRGASSNTSTRPLIHPPEHGKPPASAPSKDGEGGQGASSSRPEPMTFRPLVCLASLVLCPWHRTAFLRHVGLGHVVLSSPLVFSEARHHWSK